MQMIVAQVHGFLSPGASTSDTLSTPSLGRIEKTKIFVR